VPQWLYDITTWVTSIESNKPSEAAQNTIEMVNHFGLGKGAVALHWYNWNLLGY
jgi:hypothetical protein